MAQIYYMLIKAGTWKLENVPSLWRAQVEELLAADDPYYSWEMTEEFLNGKTIAELQAYMEAKGIDDTGCNVKADYIAMIIENS